VSIGSAPSHEGPGPTFRSDGPHGQANRPKHFRSAILAPSARMAFPSRVSALHHAPSLSRRTASNSPHRCANCAIRSPNWTQRGRGRNRLLRTAQRNILQCKDLRRGFHPPLAPGRAMQCGVCSRGPVWSTENPKNARRPRIGLSETILLPNGLPEAAVAARS
jgi:hypothetical protein